MSAPWTGGCACGAVRYSCSADAITAIHCHCRDCQRASGTGIGSHLVLPDAAVEISGEVRYFERQADSGNVVRRGFCPKCGSPVLGRSSGFPDIVTVVAGSLDEPHRFQPAMTVFRASAPPWAVVDPALPAFDRLPEELPQRLA